MKNTGNFLHNFFECLLKRMHCAEQDILKQLEILHHIVKEKRFKDALESHMQETELQIKRLEKSFNLLHLEVEEKEGGFIEGAKKTLQKGKEIASDLISMSFTPKTPSIQGIIKEGEAIFKEFENTDIHDLVLSSGVQSIEMGEVASYKTLCQIAEECGYKEILEMLKESLKEEINQSNLMFQITEKELSKFKKQRKAS